MIIKLRVLTKAPTYARTIAKPCKQGRMHYPQSPCRICTFIHSQLDRLSGVQNCPFGAFT